MKSQGGNQLNDVIGRCVGETSLIEVNFISKKMPKVGEYVSLKYDGKNVLGMIESLVRGSVSINDEIFDPKTIEKIKEIEGDDHYIKGSVRILGDIEDNLRIPRTPAPPGTEIIPAAEKDLQKIFQKQNSLSLGTLISQENVEVKVDLEKMFSRHMAILAMTGAGKSNTVAIVVDGILEYNGCVVIFDMHSEYNINFNNGASKVINPEINPLYMSFSEMKRLARISESAYIQERYFYESYKIASIEMRNGDSKNKGFIRTMREILEGWESGKTDFRGQNVEGTTQIVDVINKIGDLERRYHSIINTSAGNILSKLEMGKANIIDLGSVDESAAEVIVSHILRNALQNNKKWLKGGDIDELPLKHPVFFVLEEAHILAPNNRSTKSKLWISRIAREGRKFGLGLCLVSQSPKSIDPDSLSQANNMIILRLVEPKDQRHVQSASESLSEDLVTQLPSLNIGEAVVLGLMTKVPALVKIHEHKNKEFGQDLAVIKMWKKSREDVKKKFESEKKELFDMGGDY
ncbi:helicase HerA-like domain-containing protein [Methanobacterium alcaliphilum]|uniref:helicase HerA-like domain-containing protein n=1 Tax=Methanobacterium alcaliphilum TaxID=392018 RepID=UPI00200A21E2|nr:ATP-binding protein [Methanobacterium alcaliphilum]MCK9151705.1 ATP-binding protein [Methanobacterium alcaliphilum]